MFLICVSLLFVFILRRHFQFALYFKLCSGVNGGAQLFAKISIPPHYLLVLMQTALHHVPRTFYNIHAFSHCLRMLAALLREVKTSIAIIASASSAPTI